MRKIKFRAFLKTKKMMVDIYDISLNPAYIIGFSNDEYVGISNIIDDFELMQFTGLYDKNGKEIYEGDIIKYTNNQKGVYEIGKKMKGFIVFNEYNQCYLSKNNFQKDMNWQYAENIKVIGNIYENPELIGE